MIRKLVFFSFASFCFLQVIPVQAQNQLERISVAERADQLGYVLRYHLTNALDSAAVRRPEINRIEMELYSEGLATEDYRYAISNEAIRSVQLYEIPGGLGVRIQLNMHQYYLISSYPDRNNRDWLLAFERTDRETAEAAVESGREIIAENGHTDVEEHEEYTGLLEEELTKEEYTEPKSSDEPFGSRLSSFFDLPETDRSTISLQRVRPGDPMELYLRTILSAHSDEGSSSHNLRPFTLSGYENALYGNPDHVWSAHPFFRKIERELFSPSVNVFSQELYVSNNNMRPAGFNDGALWQGRGLNMAFSTGISAHYGPLRGVIRPIFVYSENRDFELSPHPQYPGISPYGMVLTNADIPQRFGEEPINRLDLGDSYIEAEYSGFSAGLSNQRMWTGPAIHNPLIFSNNAPGFLHAFVGTSNPLHVPRGFLEARLFWGGLRESEYFDEISSNNLRFVTGFLINYSPDYIPGLHIGMTRVAYSNYENGISFSDLFNAFRTSIPNPENAAPENVRFNKGSFFVRWAYPRLGFETYAEWGRNDNRRSIRDFIMEPELNRGYVLGVVQRVDAGKWGSIVLNGEVTNLENSSVTAQYRETNIWYANDEIRQGFTHRGQVLGAAIGPGSSTQVATVSYYQKYGMIGFSLARVAMHNDRLFVNRDYYQSRLPRDWMSIRRLHEIETRHGLHGLIFLPYNFELQFDIYTSNIENKNNQYDRPRPGGSADDILFDERNFQVSFTLRFHLNGFLR